MKNNLLNTEKAIAAYSIIFIHCSFPSLFGIIIDCLARFAVPLFFMISGYYCYSDDKINLQKKFTKKIKHILTLIIISNIIYLSWGIIVRLPNKVEIKAWLISLISIKSIIKLIFFNDFLAIHLWFLFALLNCYIIMVIINKFNLYKISYFLIPILLMINIIGTNVLYLLVGPIPCSFRNFLFLGFPFFMLGNLMNIKKNVISKINNKIIFAFILIGNLLAIFEREITMRKELYIGSIIVACFMFILAIKNNNSFRFAFTEKIGERYSLLIYLLHPIFIEIINKLFIIVNINKNILCLYGKPILICIATTLFAWTFYFVLANDRAKPYR